MTGLAAVIPQISEKVATYTATDLVTILAAVGVLVSSIVAGAVTIIATFRNGQKTENLTVKTEKLAKAVIGDEQHPGLIGQVKEVHTLTNANMTAANNKIDRQTLEMKALQETILTLHDTIKTLQALVLDLKSERDKKELAVATATVPPGTKSAETTVNMEVNEMNVEELNAPAKVEEKK